MKRSSAGFTSALSVALLLLSAVHLLPENTGFSEAKKQEYPEFTEISFSVDYDLRVSGGRAEEVTIYQSLPYDIPAESGTEKMQEVRSVKCSPDAAGGLPEPGDVPNQWTFWKLRNITGNLNLGCNISLTSRAHGWDIEGSDTGTPDMIPQSYKDAYLEDDWPVLFEELKAISTGQKGETGDHRYFPSDPGIIGVSREILESGDDVLTSARKAYEWVMENIQKKKADQFASDLQKYGPYPKNAGACLGDGYGSGVERALVLGSILRASGIPAWLSFGLGYDGDDPSNQLYGTGWLNVPVPLRSSDRIEIIEIDMEEENFLFHSPYRYTFWSDDGSFMEQNGETVHNLKFYHDYLKYNRTGFVQVNVEYSISILEFNEKGSYSMPGDNGENGLPFPGMGAILLALSLGALLIGMGRRRIGSLGKGE
ncbi:MAG: transglutaminase-like domain-containing protein [Thermoplasmatota archaeon]